MYSDLRALPRSGFGGVLFWRLFRPFYFFPIRVCFISALLFLRHYFIITFNLYVVIFAFSPLFSKTGAAYCRGLENPIINVPFMFRHSRSFAQASRTRVSSYKIYTFYLKL